MGDVVDFKKFKMESDVDQIRKDFREKYLAMDMISLLEQMVTFQEGRARIGELTPRMMVEGAELFAQIELKASTDELRLLAGSYTRHCEHELKAFLEKKKPDNQTH